MRNRNIRIQLWLNKKEADRLDKSVKKSGLSREAYLRHLINGLVPPEAPPPDYYSMMRELYRIGNNLNQIAVKAHTLGVIDQARYDESCKMLENAVRRITDAVILPKKAGLAVTSIWRVKGRLERVVRYAKNPEKTQNPDLSGNGMLEYVIRYASDPEKTAAPHIHDEKIPLMKQFVSGINCMPETAEAEMLAVKKRFGKESGIIAYHGYQSFAPCDNISPYKAHEIGLRLAGRLWGERYQVLVMTHLDKENHLHNHFVVNNVSFTDGKKYHRTKKDYRDMQIESDRLCYENSLSVIKLSPTGGSKNYGQWQAERNNTPTIRGMLKKDVDKAISEAMTIKQFFEILRDMGCEYKIQKYVYVRPPEAQRFYKLERNFGEEYSLDNIKRRILEHERVKPVKKIKAAYSCKGKIKNIRKASGFKALYFYYCYKFGVFPRGKESKARISEFKRDVKRLKEISEEIRLLAANGINTAGQLFSYHSQYSLKSWN